MYRALRRTSWRNFSLGSFPVGYSQLFSLVRTPRRDAEVTSKHNVCTVIVYNITKIERTASALAVACTAVRLHTPSHRCSTDNEQRHGCRRLSRKWQPKLSRALPYVPSDGDLRGEWLIMSKRYDPGCTISSLCRGGCFCKYFQLAGSDVGWIPYGQSTSIRKVAAVRFVCCWLRFVRVLNVRGPSLGTSCSNTTRPACWQSSNSEIRVSTVNHLIHDASAIMHCDRSKFLPRNPLWPLRAHLWL